MVGPVDLSRRAFLIIGGHVVAAWSVRRKDGGVVISVIGETYRDQHTGGAYTVDAVVTRTQAELSVFANWITTNGYKGIIGEFGIMNQNSGADQGQWVNLGYAYVDMLRVNGLMGTEWASSRLFGTGDPQCVVCASAGNYGITADQENTNSAPIKYAAAAYPTTRGMNLSGGEFFAANDSGTAATLPTTGGLYSSVNPGVLDTDYKYPAAVDWVKLSAMGIKLVRLPFAWERLQRTLGGALDTTAVSQLTTVLGDAGAAGVNVILDCHNYATYSQGTDSTHTTVLFLGAAGATLTHAHLSNLWTRMHTAFGGLAQVVGYDLMNEPAVKDNAQTYGNNAQCVANWQTASNTVVGALRTAGCTKYLIVSGWWGAPPAQWVSKHGASGWITDSLSNTVYSAHHYFDKASTYPESGTYAVAGGYTYAKELATP